MASLQTDVKPQVTRNQALGWLRQMLLIRRFEERAAMLYQNQLIGGFCHLYSGQEPTAVGSIGVLREDDYVITAYRDHGHALARGMEARIAMAELLGKSAGCSKGKGGSMHFFDVEKGFLGGHAIVGSHIPVATGVGFAIKYRGEDRVCICYFGDGAMNQGSMHEALNMASLWKLPVIYVVENNLYAMGTSLQRSSAVADLTVRGGTAYGIPSAVVDCFWDPAGVERMAVVTREAAKRARAGQGPTFIEAKTYRYRGHSMSDPAKYRTREELEKAKNHDPITAYETLLKERGWSRRRHRRADSRGSQTRGRGEHRLRRAERGAVGRGALSGHHGRALFAAGVIMPVLAYRDALNQAMSEEMERDDRVFLMGEEVAEYDGAYKVSQGMLQRFGPKRVVDTPISEEGFAGIGIGAAMVGLRPIVEFMTFSFSLVAIDQLVNNAANMRYMSGGQFAVPIVFRGNSGIAGCLGATHSHRLEAWYAQVPGLTVILPATPADAKGLLKSAIRSDDPVVFIEHEVLYADKGEVPEGEHLVPIGKADVKRAGSDVTLITYSRMLKVALAAADQLAEEGIAAEVIDVRTVRPLDLDTLVSSVAKTHRAVIVEEDWPYCGLGAGIADRITQKVFDELDAPIKLRDDQGCPHPV